MKKFLILFITLFITSCMTTSTFVEGPGSIKVEYENKYFSQLQIDSLSKSDTLPNMAMWMDLSLMEYESREKIQKKFYVKRGNVYIALIKSDSIFLTKRTEK